VRDAVEGLLRQGGRVLGLFAAEGAQGLEVRCLASGPRGDVLLRRPAPGGEVPTLLDLVPALEWDEREARDLYGLAFSGHEPHRPLVHHPADLEAWTTPVEGDDVHQVAVGPVHAGVIESGHFRFHVVGERILHVDTRLFHKHRGLERAAEGMAPEDAILVVQRACAACAATNTVAFAQAVEQARGLWPGPRMRRARTVLLELERLYNHLNDIGAVCAGVGFAPGAMAFAGFKERAQRIVRALTGHRFLFGSVAVGESRLAVPPNDAAAARRDLAELGRDVAGAWRGLLFDASLRDRLRGAGPLPREEALRLGTVGPAARASGVRRDARLDSPRLRYPGFRPAAPPEPVGDVAARTEIRALEVADTLALLDEALSARVGPGGAEPREAAGEHGVGRVEGPRGETVCAVELDGDGERVRRVHLRTASYANWPSVARAAREQILPEFPLVNKSFELCYACVDR
jgi:Ni,Fe-hydrogenase III large subunit